MAVSGHLQQDDSRCTQVGMLLSVGVELVFVNKAPQGTLCVVTTVWYLSLPQAICYIWSPLLQCSQTALPNKVCYLAYYHVHSLTHTTAAIIVPVITITFLPVQIWKDIY